MKTKRATRTTVKDARCFEWSILPILSSHLFTLSLSLPQLYSPHFIFFSLSLFLLLFLLFFSCGAAAAHPPSSSTIFYSDFSCLYNLTANNRKHVISYSAYHTHYNLFPPNQLEFIAEKYSSDRLQVRIRIEQMTAGNRWI